VRHAREVDAGMCAAQALLAAACLVFGVLPLLVVNAVTPIARELLGGDLSHATSGGWLWLTPVSPDIASYSAPLVLAGIALAGVAIAFTRNRQRRAHPVRRAPVWDCGFGGVDARMQYTASSFSMPIRRIFRPVWHVHEHIEPTASPAPLRGDRHVTLRHTLRVEDRVWGLAYEPFARWVHWSARQAARIQTGRIRTYLVHSFVTLLVLLWLVT
jgi:hypothetical protein